MDQDTSKTWSAVFKRFKEDIDSFIQRDPAAKSRLEVLLCYPGLHALMFYRVSHALWLRDWRLLGRFLSHVGKILSGIEIHPGATIGRRFFIDHGTGVVIGETAEVGDDVMLYQGVTLGGTSLEEGKRHPTLEDGVIVGSGAQVLGPHVIGAGARIGANAVVLEDVAPGVTMVGIPAKMVMGRKKKDNGDFCAYGTPDGMTDPMVRTIEMLRNEIHALKNRVEELEGDDVEEKTENKLDVVSCGRKQGEIVVKLSTKGRYAVMAMVDLACNSRGTPVSLADIAERQEISLSYLEQLFGKLRKGDLVKSVRGPGGGYLLARDCSEVRVSDIIISVDEPITATRCTPGNPNGCRENKSRCLTHDLWTELGNQIYLYLSSVSLEDIVEKRLLGTSALFDAAVRGKVEAAE